MHGSKDSVQRDSVRALYSKKKGVTENLNYRQQEESEKKEENSLEGWSDNTYIQDLKAVVVKEMKNL